MTVEFILNLHGPDEGVMELLKYAIESICRDGHHPGARGSVESCTTAMFLSWRKLEKKAKKTKKMSPKRAIKRLQRRLEWLEARIKDLKRSQQEYGYDKEEADALRVAIRMIDLAEQEGLE